MIKKILFSILFSFFILPLVVFADSDKLVFVSSEQAIKPGQVSDKVTVQLQDGSGNKKNAESTIHLHLESSSPTGMFSSDDDWTNNDNIYIRSGSANRTFYYRDSIEGEFILKVSAVESGYTFGTQKIIVSSSSNTGENNQQNESAISTEKNEEDEKTTEIVITQTSYSVHSSQSELSNVKLKKINIGAGRNRLGSVRVPLAFSAIADSAGDLEMAKVTWSFGDGLSAFGKDVYHSYQFPGKYNVVLNIVWLDGRQAVARTEVEITEPNIKLVEVNLTSGYIALKNNNSREENKNGWILQSPSSAYTFPLDTIIRGGETLKIPINLIGLKISAGEILSLAYPDKTIITAMSTKKEGLTPEETETLAKLKNQLTIAQNELKFLVQSEYSENQPKVVLSNDNEEISTSSIKNFINNKLSGSVSGETIKNIPSNELSSSTIIVKKKTNWLFRLGAMIGSIF